ncbi:MAG: sulfatase [Candidatus Zixiibacteriota bacterium]|jgi:arylsulfatase A-like enzyme
MSDNKKEKPKPTRFLGAVQFVTVAALAYALLDTVIVRVLALRANYSDYSVSVYFLRSFVIYGAVFVVLALVAAGIGSAVGALLRRRPGAVATAAGGVLFAPVLAVAVIANRRFNLTITHPAMLAVDIVVLAGWLALAISVGGRLFGRIGPGGRGVRRTIWAVTGYGGALLYVFLLFRAYALPALTRPPAPERGMNVLLISIDALRRDHLGCYGYDLVKTPNIDRFAASATKFERAYTCAPWTLPSTTSFITGRYPAVCGVDAHHRLRPGIPTLADVLRAEGYSAEAYVTNVFMHPEYGYANGFDVYLMNGDTRWLYPLRGTLLYGWMNKAIMAVDARRGRGRDDTRFNGDETIAALKRLGDADRPFFIWCHFMDPHNPYTPPRGYVPPYPGIQPAAAYDLLDTLQANGWDVGEWPMARRDVKKFEMLYDGEIAYVDEQFGLIMDALEDEGLAEDTLVFVINDHGEEFFDHDAYGHGHTLYPELINMVFLARVPGREFPRGAAGRYVTQVDVVPTILDALGITPPAELDGRSLLRGFPEGEGGRPVFAEYLQRGGERKAVARDGWLLIRDEASASRELYRISEDPGATVNLAGGNEPVEAELTGELESYVAANAAAVGAMGSSEAMELPEDRKKRLRGLGYVGP